MPVGEREDRWSGVKVLIELEVRELGTDGVGDEQQRVGSALEGECSVALERPNKRDARRAHVSREELVLGLGQGPCDDEFDLRGVIGAVGGEL